MFALSLLALAQLTACDKPIEDDGPGDATGQIDTEAPDDDDTGDDDTGAPLEPERCDSFGAAEAWDVPYPAVYDYFMYSGDGLGSYWSLTDMNGDGIQDFIVFASAGYVPGSSELFDTWRVWLGTGDGFGAEIAWALPRDFRAIDELYGANAHHLVMDMNGDGNPDLVDARDEEALSVFGGVEDPHWEVYLSDGATGFAATPTQWSVPGEEVDAVHSSRSSGRIWTTMDLDGDGQVELIRTIKPTGGNWGYEDGAPYWQVFHRDGDGFSDTPAEWSIPESPTGYDGWYDSPVELDSHTILDMTGDGLPDFVVTTSADWPFPVWGEGPDWYWKVYVNTGDGFDREAVEWSIPSDYFTFTSSAGDWGYSTSRAWRTHAIGGGEVALVIATDPETDGPFVDDDGVPQWAVFRRTDDGFEDLHTPWELPSEDYSQFFSTGGAAELGWVTMDMNGDGCDDLVQTSGGELGFPESGVQEWSWRVHLGE